MVRRSPTGACQCWRALAMPRNPRSSRLATSTSSSAPSSPASASSSCSWQLPGQPPSTHSRSPQIVATDRPWAVWACRLASYSTFWLAHPRGRCTRVASPSTTTASPAAAISASTARRSSRVATNVPSGWQNPRPPSGPSSRSRLSPTSVLEIPTMRPARRYDSPSRITAPTASRRTSSDSDREEFRMASISERESREIEAANASGTTPVVFIHGLWLLPSSWANWADCFKQAGYAPLTPDWPDDPETVEEARANPDVLAKKTLKQVADHTADVIGKLE